MKPDQVAAFDAERQRADGGSSLIGCVFAWFLVLAAVGAAIGWLLLLAVDGLPTAWVAVLSLAVATAVGGLVGFGWMWRVADHATAVDVEADSSWRGIVLLTIGAGTVLFGLLAMLGERLIA